MVLYNPKWYLDKTLKKWVLGNGELTGFVFPQDTMDYKWEVYYKTATIELVAQGTAHDRTAASAAVEKQLGYNFFIEPEYAMSKGCKCGCCEDPTGKWLVWNRSDTANLKFDNENEAIAWVESQHDKS